MRINILQGVTLGFYLFLVIFWVLLYLSGLKEGFYNYLYSFLFGLIPLVGGFVCILNSRLWGGLKSAVGKAVLLTGLGLMFWGFGETIWSYYNFFLGEPAPYPSLADLGFAPSIFFYGLGGIFLAKVTGAKYGLRSKYAKPLVVLASILLFIFCYYLLVVVARGGVLVPEGETPLKTVLDIAYPLGGFISFAVAFIVSGLSFKYLGGRYMLSIVSMLAGLAVMTIGDAVFSYTTTTGTFYNGQFGDLLLTTGLFLMTFGTLGFYKVKDQ